jgi:DNA-directed RNA polymerase II subunit RPB2
MSDQIHKVLKEETRLKIVKSYFESYGLVKHQIDSYNRFTKSDLKNIVNNEPSVKYDCPVTRSTYSLKFRNICVESPTIIDDNRKVRPLYPQEARNKDLSYSGCVCVDVIETTDDNDGSLPRITETYKVPIAKIPVMLLSDTCNLRGHTAQENESLHGHSVSDQGGYFIINGKERVLIGQVRKAYNKPLCFYKTVSQKENVLICEMRSMCEETFHSTAVQVKSVKRKIVVSLKLKGRPVDLPVGIVFKSLGFDPESEDFAALFDLDPKYDRCIETIRLNSLDDFVVGQEEHDSESEDETLVKVFRNASVNVDDGEDALTLEDVRKSLDMDLFPHLGITSTPKQRVDLLVLMVKKYLMTLKKDLPVDNRDDYNHKRVETSGELLKFLFMLLYKKFQKTCVGNLKTRKPDIGNFLRTSGITTGVLFCFSSGYWGVQRNAYIRTGVSQVVNPKVSLLANYSSMRRVVIPESKDGKETKTSGIRQIHPSTAFLICPVETPEGKSIGTVLNMAVFCGVTLAISTCEIMDLIDLFAGTVVCKCPTKNPTKCYTILVNGSPYGLGHVDTIKTINFLNDTNISIMVNDTLKVIEIYSDSGRLIRPVFDLPKIAEFKGPIEPSFSFFLDAQLIKYVDSNEVAVGRVAIEPSDVVDNPNTSYDMMELHPCGMFGIVAGTIPFSDRTQSARNCFYTSMVKQAIGFVPCHNLKTETVSYSLNYPQKPLVTTDIAEFNSFNEYPNGINAIVAIACYTGYNQEDSIILNKASIERGMFGTVTYNTHTAAEKKNGLVEERIKVPDDSIKIRDCNYGLLDSAGVVRLRQRVSKGDVLIGKTSVKNKNDEERVVDVSIVVQQGEDGYVDRIVDVVVDGSRTVKVVVAQLRLPEIGDKFCSGMAQKGTCGMVYPEYDMPFTACGMTPDIIINPNCIPSRMTINQVVATVMGKIYCMNPDQKFRQGNPFMENSATILNDLCDELTKHGFNHTGGETMFCGFTGRQIKSDIFMGPTYYHRLKHMVKDKMHARSHGQVTTLHRQPLCGRSQGGGLRFGEMEKDCILVHGATQFLNERMFLYSDPFQVNVCASCGMMCSTSKKCHVCGSIEVKKCNMPYSFKNLLQELNGMGIKTKIDVA